MIEFNEHVSRQKHSDLTPMIDVVFLLLIFFLLTSVSSRMMVPLNLPEAETSTAAPEAPVVVAIRLDGMVYVNGERVEMRDLYATLAAMYVKTDDGEINLMSDEEVPFGRVVDVLDIAKRAGAKNIAVVTERKVKVK